MDVKEVAKEAQEAFKDVGYFQGGTAAKIAILGFLRGVEEGNVTVGQSWFAEALMRVSHGSYAGKQAEVLEKVFASGMCCGGQQLGSTLARGHGGRGASGNWSGIS